MGGDDDLIPEHVERNTGIGDMSSNCGSDTVLLLTKAALDVMTILMNGLKATITSRIRSGHTCTKMTKF